MEIFLNSWRIALPARSAFWLAGGTDHQGIILGWVELPDCKPK
jgi:hypothetical protein